MVMSASSNHKRWSDCYDMIGLLLGKPTDQSNIKILSQNSTKKKKKFKGASQWSLNDWISILAEGGGANKRFQYCLNPNTSRHISYVRAIQGHLGDKCYWSWPLLFVSRHCIFSAIMFHVIWSFFCIKCEEVLSYFDNLQTSVRA